MIIASVIYKYFDKTPVAHTRVGINWGVDLADIQLISKYNEGISFFSCDIAIFSKYAWFFLSMTKNVLQLLMLL